jgi:hypothetical protein
MKNNERAVPGTGPKIAGSTLPLKTLKRTFLREDFFHPTDNAACQTNLNAMRMCGRLRKKILNNPLRQFPGALILFLHNLNPGSRFNIRSISATHL